MTTRIDGATAAFLDAAADDLQRQAGRAGVVERIGADMTGDMVTLVATIRVGTDVFQVPASGDNLLAAYARLTRYIAEPMLASAFRGVVAS